MKKLTLSLALIASLATAEVYNPKDIKQVYSKKIAVKAEGENVTSLFRRVANKLKLNFSEDCHLAKDVDIAFTGTLEDFIREVYSLTGVKYTYKAGFLRVENKDTLNCLPDYKVGDSSLSKGNSDEEDEVTYSFTVQNVTFDKALYMLSKKYHINFIYDIPPKEKAILYENLTTFSYQGNSVEEMIQILANKLGLSAEKIDNRTYKIGRYATLSIRLPLSFNRTIKDGLNFNNATADTSFVENFKAQVLNLVKGISPTASVDISPSGILTVKDTPTSLVEIKKVLNKQLKALLPLKIKVQVVKVTEDTEKGNGINWSGVFKLLNNFKVEINSNFQTGGGITIGKSGGDDFVSLLSSYSNVKVVKELKTTTNAGKIIAFKDAVTRRYAEGKVVVEDGKTNYEMTTKEFNAGIGLLMQPTLSPDDQSVNLNIVLKTSDLVGEKELEFYGNKVVLPITSDNSSTLSANIPIGGSLVLAGYNSNENGDNKQGSYDHKGLFGKLMDFLFGSNQTTIKNGRYIVIISVDR